MLEISLIQVYLKNNLRYSRFYLLSADVSFATGNKFFDHQEMNLSATHSLFRVFNILLVCENFNLDNYQTWKLEIHNTSATNVLVGQLNVQSWMFLSLNQMLNDEDPLLCCCKASRMQIQNSKTTFLIPNAIWFRADNANHDKDTNKHSHHQ